MSRQRTILIVLIAAAVLAAAFCCYRAFFRPTRILVVNALPAQAAELLLNNDNPRISIDCRAMDQAGDFEKYDAVLMYGRGLYLDSAQTAALERAAGRGVPIFTNTLRNFSVVVNRNVDSIQVRTLNTYFRNACGANYRNMVRYVRSFATPGLVGDKSFEEPVELPSDMFYHRRGGEYFGTARELTDYLKREGIYNEGGRSVALISGVNFPVEGNRAHVDTLISRLTALGYNVYPLSAAGTRRAEMLRSLDPAAVVYLPMGRLGNDSLVDWLYARNTPLFMPFPLIQPRNEWLDVNKPLDGGTLNARIVVPEIDGAMAPLCISTQDTDERGLPRYNPVPERVDAFLEQFDRFMTLRTTPNRNKRIAIAYFKSPGKDALLASGMEVVPSLYNLLRQLRAEGYDLDGLPDSEDAFRKIVMEQGAVMGAYAPAAQQEFMDGSAHIWIDKDTYRQWAAEVLEQEQYAKVEERYGPAPGNQLARGDSLAIAGLRFGNVFLFPQPRPAIGDDEFKMVHGAEVVPPHSYLAPYLYMQKEFNADALLHFGTHGNLEFTPGKNAGLSQADWAEVLIGNRPHFYVYTTGNVGEAIIAKRRSHAVIISHLTPPFVESGMRGRYSSLTDDIHRAIASPAANTPALKKRIIAEGLHSDLGLDSTASGTYSAGELKQLDSFIEELMNEKITGAYYVMNRPYSEKDLTTTVMAICADKLAYARGRRDRDAGKISAEQLGDYTYIAHHYLDAARANISALLGQAKPDTIGLEPELADAVRYRELLLQSPAREFSTIIGALAGVPVHPGPGGDPVANPNVLPTGNNMFSINAEATPGVKAWTDGVALADQTLKNYYDKHGDYPHQVSYTFWAGEFISSQGATVAQALRMLGVEPVRDAQGRVMDLRLTPSAELGRPRVNVMVQVSGQLRDIAGSRLKLITDAVAMASGAAANDVYPNYVAESTVEQERQMVADGMAPDEARKLSVMRVFGPVNSGYSTGMLPYTENSGSWDDRGELVEGYLNNMCAMYGDDDNWGRPDANLLKAAVRGTDVIVQPRQSNTWGPISLDHVYEFTGALSLVAGTVGGKEPDAVMADYRNTYLPRLQDANQAVAVETRATVLNPEFIRQRMQGDAGTAQMFGEIFRNIFGWTVMRPSVLNDNIFDSLYDTYVADVHGLGINEYFDRVNPAAYQEMTAVMLESARKGYWQPTDVQLKSVAEAHARMTERNGAPCTEFVCVNRKLQQFTAAALDAESGRVYTEKMQAAVASTGSNQVLKEERMGYPTSAEHNHPAATPIAIIGLAVILLIALILAIKKTRKK